MFYQNCESEQDLTLLRSDPPEGMSIEDEQQAPSLAEQGPEAEDENISEVGVSTPVTDGISKPEEEISYDREMIGNVRREGNSIVYIANSKMEEPIEVHDKEQGSSLHFLWSEKPIGEELPLFDIKRTERYVYAKDSLDAVPFFACPCQICVTKYGDILQDDAVCEHADGTLERKFLRRTYFNSQVHHAGNQEMDTQEKRLESFQKGKPSNFKSSVWPMEYDLAKAGFFLEGKEIKCFKCPLTWRFLDKRLDPFREHARWFPCCDFVRETKGDGFIHNVLQDTLEMIHAHHEMRETMDYGIVQKYIMENHDPHIILQAIVTFFVKFGGYPSDQMLSELIGPTKENDNKEGSIIPKNVTRAKYKQ